MDLVFFIVFIVSIVALAFNNVRMYVKYNTSLKTVIKLTINENILKEKLSLALLENSRIQSDDGFVKFLSESRDWAFAYIEDVQQKVFVLKEKYDKKVELDESLTELFDMLPQNNKEK
jgi:hypothetical protein